MPATILMECLQRVSPQFVAAELDKLGLLDAADQATDAVLAKLRPAAARRPRKLVAMVALAMCATILVAVRTTDLLPQADGSRFMQLAGPTPEW
jgi:hypothetical protein